jgi:thiazole synthase ThiGH ThiG subunit
VMNTAIAGLRSERMALAMKLAIGADPPAYLAGRMPAPLRERLKSADGRTLGARS